MTDEIPGPGPAPAPAASGGWGLIVPGAIMLVVGLILAVTTFGRETPGSNDPGEFVAWNAGLTIGGAVLVGVGLLLLALGYVRRRRRSAERR
jgi:hypothetical protein